MIPGRPGVSDLRASDRMAAMVPETPGLRSCFRVTAVLVCIRKKKRSTCGTLETAVAHEILCSNKLFIAALSDNPTTLTGCSYYPLYEGSMLKASYEFLSLWII
ncbi:hypothetical protein UY3_07179 [Chelonia mydas]|uniref:Uncharacterized protein n=1 Tax=Chelonia mydas TaxID=8469 RepID=M7C572_CHEMY|nr:hypothetical protein UY3_07179 [Chelonia mydas]